MKRIAKFHKVSWKQFLEGWKDSFGEQDEYKILEISRRKKPVDRLKKE